MPEPELHVVTGAFGYTGRHIARRLLNNGIRVRTLTSRPGRPNPFGERVEAAPLDFGDADGLARNLDGARVLYNTYWIRFARADVTFERAVENSLALIRAAERSGVRRIVHVSITNASTTSPLPYFRSKGLVEEAVRSSRLDRAIVRPTVIFGPGDILLNNIAWGLRRFPVFPVPGSGRYLVQPVFVEDVARIAVDAGRGAGDLTVDAVGPDAFGFEDLVRMVAAHVSPRARLVRLPPSLFRVMTAAVGPLVNDVVLTREEVAGLMAGLLISESPPTGKVSLESWLAQNADSLGKRYASELDRHYR